MSAQVTNFDALAKMTVQQFLTHIRRAPEPPAPMPRPPATPAPSMGEPTRERRSKEPNGFDEKELRSGTVYVAAEVLHRARDPLDIYGTYFSTTELAAASYFAEDAEAASIVNVTARWDGMPHVGAKAMGGGVADSKRARYHRFCNVLERLPEEMRSVLALLVLCVRSEANASSRPDAVWRERR